MTVNTEALFDLLAENGLDPEYAEEETELVFPCPLCGDDRPRCYVGADTGIWICFRCDERGTIFTLLTRICELDGHDAYEARRKIVTEDVDPWREVFREVREAEATPASLGLTLPPGFRQFDENAPAIYRRYLESRHVSLELAAARNIGYCAAGQYAYRIILPVENDNVLYSFVARTIFRRCPACGLNLGDCSCRSPIRRVLNPPGGSPAATLYNLDHVRRSQPLRIILVEGPFDALRLPDESVALMRSAISTTQLTLLAGISRGRDLVLALDGDDAGRHGTKEIAEQLASSLIPCRIAHLPDDTDPGSLPLEVLEEVIAAAKPFRL
mgnify:CR=1 FL=1